VTDLPAPVEGFSERATVGDLVVFDQFAWHRWPGFEWLLVVRIGELAPGVLDVEVKGGTRFTWPADRPVLVRLPRPEAAGSETLLRPLLKEGDPFVRKAAADALKQLEAK